MAYDPHLRPHVGDLDPEAVASREFAEARRGYEPSEVQAYLQVVAEEFRAARQREHELRLQIADLERQLLDTEDRVAAAEARHRTGAASPSSYTASSLHDLDEVELTILVGEETAKVLAAARGAASEIRANAERTASEMHRKATESADRVAAAAEDRLDQRARDAEADMARRIDETDAAIGLALAEAAEQRDRMRAEADEAAAAVLADADRRLDDARHDAVRLVEEARTEAAAQRAQAEADGADIVARARDDGRQLMAEVQEVRTRMLEDLVRRRKALRRQVEQLHAGRERFLAAFDATRSAMATIDDELARSLPEARAAAEAAGRRADDEPDAAASELEAMLDPAPTSSSPEAADDRSVATDDRPPVAEPPATSVFSRLRSDGADSADSADQSDPNVDPSVDGPDERADDDPSARPAVPHLVVVPAAVDDEADERAEPDVAAPTVPPELQLDESFDPSRSRDALLDELIRPVVRRMKRSLTDEQNEVLDAVRRRRPLPSLDELLAPVAEHERRYAEAVMPGLAKAAAAGQELPAVIAEEMHPSNGQIPPADPPPDVPAVRDLAAALAVEVVGGLRATLETCLSGADLLRADPKRPVGAKGPTKAAVNAQADDVSERVRLAYREVRTRRVDDAAIHAVRSSFGRGLGTAAPSDLTERLLDGLADPVAPVLVD